MKRISGFLIPVIICFLVGVSASFIQSDSIEHWYPFLKKPSLTPPNIVFPIAWSILYLCMGVSIGFIINSQSPKKKYFMGLFAAQLFLNFMWSILFFYFRNPLWGLIDILALDVVIINYAIKTYKEFRISSLLFFPYIAWVTFATYLNLYILYNN